MANQLILSNWHKAYMYAGCALGMWLAASAPIGKVGKGASLSLSLLHGVALVRTSRKLIEEEAATIARAAMNKELRNTEMVLETEQIESELARVYATETSSEAGSTPEIIDELRESLEALWLTVAESSSSEVPGSGNRKSLYLAVVNLLKTGKTETFVIKEVLQQQGRSYQSGKDFLQELLQEGKENEW
ncbi:hypothetical protein [Brunnivagina elsteri]|uniref:Uncharacterized protein n=1 Tax=Brunnivagina elsteri CCALA 953 TaxID=987040 RepID=A0A2A2TEH9_9CYAN|nr:hypothetical protein [Calothrix elsteri]PAX52056.1 hypothetical protein CK510_21355 [Calothrix elsteri CCALA 953]